MRLAAAELEARAKKIKLLALDVDGVLTDGAIWVTPEGGVSKRFDIRDGHGLVFVARAGVELAIISGRTDAATQARATELKIAHVLQGVRVKLDAAKDLASKLSLSLDEVAYIGDDVNDAALIAAAGIGAAPSDAVPEALAAAHWIASQPGGHGAVRSLCELILKARSLWPPK